MATIYMIIYDLRNPGRDYNGLYETIKSLSSDWQHPLESTWFIYISQELSSQAIFEKLKEHIDKNDNLFIINVNNSKDRQGWMHKTFWKWITDKQPK